LARTCKSRRKSGGSHRSIPDPLLDKSGGEEEQVGGDGDNAGSCGFYDTHFTSFGF